MNHEFDATRLSLLLNDLRLPAIKQIWSSFAERSDTEGWPAARLLMALAEHEIAERDRRRIERHLRDARLLPGKTLENFDFDAVPMVSRAHVSALCAGDGWLRNGANLILLGPSGGGKSHLSSAIGLSLLENGWKVLFARTTDLVQGCRRTPRAVAGVATTGWIDSISLFWTTLHTSARIRPRRRCCSSSSAPGMSTVLFC
uniref:ATP-binding protein n=1 Tax=Pseudomonas aeruginosa TaxID=287 RepID=O87615_PSEAI|nr:ATP-binding protein [Pseudomonas aeruginosa]